MFVVLARVGQEPSATEDDFAELSDALWEEAEVDVDTPTGQEGEQGSEDHGKDLAGEAPAPQAPRQQAFENPFLGSFRLVGGFLHFPDFPEPLPQEDEAVVAVVGRLMAEQALGMVSTEANIYLEVTRLPGAQFGGTFMTAGTTESAYRAPLRWDFWSDGAVEGRLGIDRIALRFRRKRVSFGIGRFPVNHSVTFIVTPNDWFAPFSATTINKIYKPGVDAVQLGVSLGGLSSMDVVATMGYGTDGIPSWGRAALVARFAVVLWGIEWAVMGGKIAERWMAGASLQGDVGRIGIRGEGHVGLPDADGDGHLDGDRDPHVRLAIGPNVNFAWKNATVSAEYAFWSDGAREPEDYLVRAQSFYPDDLPYLGRHYVGISTGLELIPILRADLLGLVNAGDGSGLVGGFLGYSISDEADLAAGAYVPWGKAPVAGDPLPSLRSEFGVAGLTLFVEARTFF